jgi:ketosteroid isomerase-like protein
LTGFIDLAAAEPPHDDVSGLIISFGYMNRNEETMRRFYHAFQQLDAATMQQCYAGKVIFYDPVFEDLVDDEVRLMWEMLCTRAQDLSVSFTNITADEEYGNCDWEAHYRFARTGRKVINKVRAHMRFENGKIVEHSDQFKLSSWCSQALGLSGVLFGGMGWFQRRVRKSAQRALYDYILKKRGENKI